MKSHKYMDIKEFWDQGWVHEINRLFLHPVGMALEVQIDDTGVCTLGGIWDYRDDPTGIQFEKIDQDKVERVRAIMMEKHPQRQSQLSYVIQMD
jgi:hypothetical protein